MAGAAKRPMTAIEVRRATEPGYYTAGYYDPDAHHDSRGLYLRISRPGKKNRAGVKTWAFCYRIAGRDREMGLGPIATVTLADARAKVADYRKGLLAGIDPISEREKVRDAEAKVRASRITFDQAAEQYIESHRAGWKSLKHADQWTNTLSTYASPVMGKLAVADVDVAHVIRVLEPIWITKTETASRVRGRIESVLGWAKTRGFRSGDNPARWHDHLENLLPERTKVRKVEHFAALPASDLGAFMAELRKQEGEGARALEFTILTACRTNETIGATWSEVDLDASVWVIPAARMKMDREHRVPLSDAARAILEATTKAMRAGYIFHGLKEGKPLSNMAMLKTLERMGRTGMTVHGFRSTFRDWTAENTNFPREVSEQALAHAIGDKVEAAYRRGDLFEKRKKLMQQWATFLERQRASATVIPMDEARTKEAA